MPDPAPPDLAPLRAVIAQYGIDARRSLGQHFLLDPNLTGRIARAAGDLTRGTTIEIGPGPGGLTRALLAAGAERIVAIERDRRCVAALADLSAAYPGRLTVVEADALDIPFDDGSFDAVTIAFGLSNLPDYAAGVREMARVLKPGGRLVVLEFFPPTSGAFLQLYRLYLKTVLPVVGRAISGSRQAYDYLSSSIRGFASHDEVHGFFRAAGLENVGRRRLSGGISYIYRGFKP